MGEGGAVLEYAAGAPRRRWRRWVVAIVALLLVGVVIAYRHPILRRGRLLYWQHGCLTYTRPPRIPVSTTRPSAGSDPDYAAYPLPDGTTAYALSPQCWAKFDSERLPRLLPVLVQRIGVGPSTVFLHERVSPAGHRRLVRVEPLLANALSPALGYDVTLTVPGSVWAEPRGVGKAQLLNYSGQYVPAEFFFGQVDPNDASHFTIEYAVRGQPRGTVDAWLRDDDTVVFKLRNPASTQGL